MVQPFNYNTVIANPGAAFQQSYAQGLELQAAQEQMQMARMEAQRKAAEQAELRAGMIATSNANTPLEFLEVRKKFPMFAGALSKEFMALDDVRKNATYDSGQKAFALLSSGPDGQAKAVEALLADADRFKNSNMPDMEKKARDLAEIVKISPDARKAIGIHMAAIAPDKWEKFAKAMGPAERTTFQKDLAAAGIDPESPEGIRQSRAFVQNRTDPIVTMETPRGGQFTGPLSEFQRRYGSPATSMGVTVTTPDGQTFNFPNENAANLFRKKAGLE